MLISFFPRRGNGKSAAGSYAQDKLFGARQALWMVVDPRNKGSAFYGWCATKRRERRRLLHFASRLVLQQFDSGKLPIPQHHVIVVVYF